MHTLLTLSCHNLAYDNINPFTEEAFKPSKRTVDTPEEYLRWNFGKVKGKKGLYLEYKAVSTENLVIS